MYNSFLHKRSRIAGENSVITARFETTNRPGTFNKTLTVVSNAEQSNMLLTIKGTVIPRTKTLADEYPEKIGNLRLSSRFVNLTKVNTKELVSKEIVLYNDGDKALSFSGETAPAHIKISIEPKTLNPKEKGVLKITYDGKAKNDFGYVTDLISFNTNETDKQKKELNISANIEEYFPPLSAAELANAPKIYIEKKEHDFGNIVAGSIVTTEFKITNTGKQDLSIRKTKANCGCTVSEPEKKLLKPGETSSIKVSYNSTGKKGADIREVTVYTNDPSASAQTMRIRAWVNEKSE
jgi:hypothetical protein